MTDTDPLTRFVAALASVQELDSLQHRLCEAARIVLHAGGVAVTSQTVDDGRRTVCWTDLRSRRFLSWQDSIGEGPVIDSLRTGSVTVGEFDGDPDHRWPHLRREVADVGYAGVLVAIPLRSELRLAGAVLAHREGLRRGTDETDARFLGAALGTAVLQDPATGAQGHVFAEVLSDRDVVHRATGEVERSVDIRYEDALALLRAVAFTRGEDLGAVATSVVDGRLHLGPAGT